MKRQGVAWHIGWWLAFFGVTAFLTVITWAVVVGVMALGHSLIR